MSKTARMSHHGACVACGWWGASPKTRQELYDIAKQKHLPGRSGVGRGELARLTNPVVGMRNRHPGLRGTDGAGVSVLCPATRQPCVRSGCQEPFEE